MRCHKEAMAHKTQCQTFFVVGWGQLKSQTLVLSQTKQLLSKGHVTLVAWQGLKESLLKSRGGSCHILNIFWNHIMYHFLIDK